jgi:hypothetical protein
MNASFHPSARAELLEAHRWYQARSPVSAFAQEVSKAVSRIKEAPMRHPVANYGTRKIALTRFPFNLIYRVDAAQQWS